MYRDTTNVEPEMYDYTNNKRSHWNSNEKLKEKLGSCTKKTFDRFTTKDSYSWNITHNTESTAVWSLKPERWGSPLVQEKYQEEKACDERHPYRIIITIKFLSILATTYRLTQGGHPESLLALHNMIFTNTFILLNSLYLTSSKYLPECIKCISLFSYMQSPRKCVIPLCVWNWKIVCSQTQLCHMRCI